VLKCEKSLQSLNVSKMLEGFGECLDCTAYRQNSFTEKAGATSKEACKCNAGYFGETLCEGCPVGKIKVWRNISVIIMCILFDDFPYQHMMEEMHRISLGAAREWTKLSSVTIVFLVIRL
jgi:hypothetical protein